MTDEKKKMTAQGSSVGADDGQSISKNSENSMESLSRTYCRKRLQFHRYMEYLLP